MEKFWIQGVVRNGQVVLEKPLDLPDGTVVTVMEQSPDGAAARPPAAALTPELVEKLAGMWADRPEMADPDGFVRKLRGGGRE